MPNETEGRAGSEAPAEEVKDLGGRQLGGTEVVEPEEFFRDVVEISNALRNWSA